MYGITCSLFYLLGQAFFPFFQVHVYFLSPKNLVGVWEASVCVCGVGRILMWFLFITCCHTYVYMLYTCCKCALYNNMFSCIIQRVGGEWERATGYLHFWKGISWHIGTWNGWCGANIGKRIHGIPKRAFEKPRISIRRNVWCFPQISRLTT